MTSFVGPELLRPEHEFGGFDCGDGALNWWLANRAARSQLDGGSRTWVVTDGHRVNAYYASSTAVLLRVEATTRAARNQPDPLPALLLGRLAVDLSHQRRGLGAALIKHFFLKSREVAELTGVRILLVHATGDAAAQFYCRYGFAPSPMDDHTLMLIIGDLSQ